MKLTTNEIETANLLKTQFGHVREEISIIEKEMEFLTHKAGTLIRELERLRDDEKNFVEQLTKKYGDGVLDPYKLTYSK